MPYIHGKSIIKIAVADDHEMFRELVAGCFFIMKK